MRVLYLYFMKAEPDRVRQIASEHASYWRGLALSEFMGGPFGDRSGGLITFEARSEEDAWALVAGDPFVRTGLVADRWLKEWQVE